MSNHRIAWAAALAVSHLLPGAAVFVWREAWWPLIVFVLWSALAALLFVAADRRQDRRRHDRLIAHTQRAAVEMLGQHRHAWMNEVQILYGYLKLKKYDKAIDVVDRIRLRMEKDSRISRIGIPGLAVYLLSFRAAGHTIRLEAEIEEGWKPELAGPDPDKLTGAVAALVNVVRIHAAVPREEPPTLWLYFGADGRRARLSMEFDGEVPARDIVPQEMERALDGFGSVKEASEAGGGEEAGRLRWTVAFPPNERIDQPA